MDVCVIVLHLLKNRHKSEPRAKACVFLGYHVGYKGYKLLDIETHSTSVSTHILFHENIFPFASSSIIDDTKAFFPLLKNHASLEVSLHFVQTSSDSLVPSEPQSRRKIKTPHL